MPWQQRGDKRYYYQAFRINGRASRRYVGRGARGEAAAAEIERRRSENEERKKARQADDAARAAALAPVVVLCDLTDLLVHAALLTNGFRQHNRGTWRKKRHVNNDDSKRDGCVCE